MEPLIENGGLALYSFHDTFTVPDPLVQTVSQGPKVGEAQIRVKVLEGQEIH